MDFALFYKIKGRMVTYNIFHLLVQFKSNDVRAWQPLSQKLFLRSNDKAYFFLLLKRFNLKAIRHLICVDDFFKTQLERRDQALHELIQRLGTRNWGAVARALHLELGYKERSGKQCRERWHNHLNPDLSRDKWSDEEQKLIFDLHSKYGNKWTIISQQLHGRTDNAIKNFFYSTIRRSLRRMSKIVGQKNSTIFVRKLKPITLSKIFSAESQFYDPDELLCRQSENAQKLQQIKKICLFLKTQILAFTQTSIDKKSKSQRDKETFDSKKFQTILEQIFIINKYFWLGEYNQSQKAQNNKEVYSKAEQIEEHIEESLIKSQLDPIIMKTHKTTGKYLKRVKRQQNNPEIICRDQDLSAHLLQPKHNEIHNIHSQYTMPCPPVLQHPYFYSPLLYFEPLMSTNYYFEQPRKYELPNDQIKQCFMNSQHSYQNKQKKLINQKNLVVCENNFNNHIQQKVNINKTQFEYNHNWNQSFALGKIPSLQQILSNCRVHQKNIFLTSEHYNILLTDCMNAVNRRLQQWSMT